MRILPISESIDREAWLEWRRDKVTGSRAGDVLPLSRGADRNPMGLWDLLAGKIAIDRDGEDDMARGHRLEKEALARFTKETGLAVSPDCGVWQDEECEDIALSPDASDPSDKPKYAVEVKCLASKNHLKHVVTWLLRSVSKFYELFNVSEPKSILDYIPKEYREQAIHYFVVNPDLETLYFVFYDDRIVIDSLVYTHIPILRSDLDGEVEAQRASEIQQIGKINSLIEILKGL